MTVRIEIGKSGAFGWGGPTPFVGREAEIAAARDFIGYDPTRSQVTLETADSLARLAMGGFNAQICYTDIPSYVSPDVRQQVHYAVTEREKQFPRGGLANDLFDLDGAQGNIHWVGRRWEDQSKRAHALLVLSYPGFEWLGGHARSEALHRGLFSGGRSAVDLLHMMHKKEPTKAEYIARRVSEFLDTPYAEDGRDRFGLMSRDYLAAVPDSEGVRKREALSIDVITDHAKTIPEVAAGERGLRVTSMACGAGNMLCKLVPHLSERGVAVDQLDALDHDPVALAVLQAHAEGSGIGDLIKPMMFNLIKSDSSELTKDTDIKEMLGLFEYLEKRFGGPLGYKLAEDYLRSLAKDMKPGSMILFGNMVESRPHQTMFNQVWPKLQQRSPEEVVRLILSAGYPPESINVHMADDGLYAVYTITIPEGGIDMPPRSPWQKFVRHALLRKVEEY